MADIKSGRLPAEAFYTITDAEQARLLSDRISLKYFRPFVAKERSATEAAEALGVALDTMLYRIKTFLKAGLIYVSRLEKRAGRPIKHYRSVHDAYIIPFALTPHANLEETLHLYFRECAEIVVPPMARTMRQSGREGRILYRDANDGTVWQSSYDIMKAGSTLYDSETQLGFVGQYRGSVGDFMDDRLELTDAEVHELLSELRDVWQRFRHKKESSENQKEYFFQFVLVAP